MRSWFLKMTSRWDDKEFKAEDMKKLIALMELAMNKSVDYTKIASLSLQVTYEELAAVVKALEPFRKDAQQ